MWGPDSGAGASGWRAPGSAAAASPGLRGSGGQSRHPHRRPQEVGPPLAFPSRPAALVPPPAWPRPRRDRPPLGSAPPLRRAEHHREGRAPPRQRGLRARAPPGGAQLPEPEPEPGPAWVPGGQGALGTHLYARS